MILFRNEFNYYSTPVGVRSIVINPSVCVSVCLSVNMSLEWQDRFTQNFVCRSPVAVARSSSCGIALCCVLLDDVTFGRNGRDAERWRVHCAATAMNDMAIPGRSLMSMNAC